MASSPQRPSATAAQLIAQQQTPQRKSAHKVARILIHLADVPRPEKDGQGSETGKRGSEKRGKEENSTLEPYATEADARLRTVRAKPSKGPSLFPSRTEVHADVTPFSGTARN